MKKNSVPYDCNVHKDGDYFSVEELQICNQIYSMFMKHYHEFISHSPKFRDIGEEKTKEMFMYATRKFMRNISE